MKAVVYTEYAQDDNYTKILKVKDIDDPKPKADEVIFKVKSAALSRTEKGLSLTSYGVQKAIGELLLNDYSRRGFFDGVGLRIPTLCVRPGGIFAIPTNIFHEVSNVIDAAAASSYDTPSGIFDILTSGRCVTSWNSNSKIIQL